jgi:rare lipoprotein A
MKKKIWILFVSILFVAGCSSSPRFHSGRKEIPNNNSHSVRYNNTSAKKDSVLETKYGVASYYADKFHGKITYSGEVYDMNGISAAHPFYPMGTVVRITNLTNNKTVTLTINDKMPYREDRIIDLSLGAAKALGMENEGITNIKLEVLKWGKGRK